jgi:dihydrofolate reductase
MLKSIDQRKIAKSWSLDTDGHEAGSSAAKPPVGDHEARPSASRFAIGRKEPPLARETKCVHAAYTHFVFESRAHRRIGGVAPDPGHDRHVIPINRLDHSRLLSKEQGMRKLIVFNQITLDGYFTDAKGDMSWARKQDPEWTAFTSENASGGGELLFGRVTYEMMSSFWPTPQAHALAPTVAQRMNQLPKVVFSRTLERADWNNTKLVQGNIEAEVQKLKAAPGQDLVLMGSGSVVSQLAQARLIDSYQIVISPTVLGRGRTLFAGVTEKFQLKLEKTRTFSNGNVVLWYTLA